MAPRLNKRQQREQGELLALGRSTPDVEAHSEDEDTAAPAQRTGTGFAAFLAPEDEGEEDSLDDGPSKIKKSKKKKKKGSKQPAVEQAPSPPPQKSASPAKKPSKKKEKGKSKKDEGDEIDKALAELSVEYPALLNPVTSSVSPPELAPLLAVSLAHLDADAEMRKFLGARVVAAAKASSAGSSRKRQGGVERSHLAHPQSSWWPAKLREGLSIRPLNDEEVEQKHLMEAVEGGDERWWTVEYSKKYKGVTRAFIQTVMSGDPEGFYRLLGKLPWHADTLLQLSEVYRHREEYSQAADFVERALFTYERAFVGAFSFTNGLNRLDFDQVENRPFFLALHRQIADLQRRGCVRTAFEVARLLWALDPHTDPHGALLHLDVLAIRAGMGPWLLDVWAHFDAREYKGIRLDPSVLPGWAYTRAIVLRAEEKDGNHEASTAALKDAIASFPAVVPLLADKADIQLSAEIRGHRSFRIAVDASGLSAPEACLHLLSHHYAQRATSLWKDSALSAWLTSTASSVLSHLPATPTRRQRFLKLYAASMPQFSAYRHVYVLDARPLLAFVPRGVLDARQLACDPLPPATAVNVYNEDFFRGAEDVFAGRRGRREEERMMERLVPDARDRQQLQALFDANPQFAERFPGGVVQLAQLAGQLPAEVLDGLLLAMAEGAPVALEDRGMPGGMGEDSDEEMFGDGGHAEEGGVGHGEQGEESSDGESDEEEDENLENVSPMPVRLIRNLINRFWGTTSVAQEEDSSEDDGDEGTHDFAPADDGGVD